jgi:hypothetical protein
MLLGLGWREIIERAGGNTCSILTQCWPSIIANQDNVQDNVVITRIGMMPVSEPIAGTNVNFDVPYSVFALLATFIRKGSCSTAA